MKTTKEQIAIVHTFDKLAPDANYNSKGKEIHVSIGVTTEKNGKVSPHNFSLDYETPKTSTGGCFVRIYAYESSSGTVNDSNIFSTYGPDITYGDLNAYKHAVRAMERIDKKTEAMKVERGYSADAAESMGRWLEATGIKEVWIRPSEEAKSNGWLCDGSWDVLTIGQFVNRVRQNLYVKPVVATSNEITA